MSAKIPQHSLNYIDNIARLFITSDINADYCRGINGYHPYVLIFKVTDNCNMRCSHCYQQSISSNHMSLETAKSIIDMLLVADERTNKYITSTKALGVVLDFVGGESLLEIDLINQICDYFVEQCFILKHPWATRWHINIHTNGLLYFDSRVQAFFKKWQDRITITINEDGCRESHDIYRLDSSGAKTFDKVESAVQHYKDTYNKEVNCNLTLSPDNVNLTSKSIMGFVNNGYKEIGFDYKYDGNWTANHARIFYAQLKEITEKFVTRNLFEEIYLSLMDIETGKTLSSDRNSNYCGGTGYMLCVNYKGDFYTCLRFDENCLGSDSYKIGDLTTGIMNKPEYVERVNCLSGITRRSLSTDECYNCPIARNCGWCSACNYMVTGNPNNRITNICIMHKARTLGVIYHWNRYAQIKNEASMLRQINFPYEFVSEIISEDEYNTLKQMGVNNEE